MHVALGQVRRYARLFAGIGAFVSVTGQAQTIGLSVGDSARVHIAPSARLIVPVRINPGTTSLTLASTLKASLTWNAGRLTLDSLRAASTAGYSLFAFTPDIAGGSATFSIARSTPLAAAEVFATAYFTAASSAGGTRVVITPTALGDSTVLAQARQRNLDVCVAPTGKWGDANDDAVVNIIDAQQIARASVGLAVASETAVAERGDVTADGLVNIIDAQQLARYSVGLIASARANVNLYVPPAVASVAFESVVPRSLSTGAVAILTAVARDSAGRDVAGCVSTTWNSSNASVLRVSGEGVLDALVAGSATVSASASSKSTSSALTVVGMLSVARVSFAAGLSHTCGISVIGASYCWGSNASGQLGLGTRVGSAVPAQVTDGQSFVALSAGDSHSCGLTADGVAHCWGSNYLGMLGDGTVVSRNTPTLVSVAKALAVISAGGEHTCALDTDGVALCWGRNLEGQIGDSTFVTSRSTPTAVTTQLRFVSLTSGQFHTCALTKLGAAYCWGLNGDGQLGNGSTASVAVPVAVGQGLVFAGIRAAGRHTCAWLTSGAAYCWGRNWSGQLGNGTTTNRALPTAVIGGRLFVTITTGSNHTCGLTSSGAPFCWGAGGVSQTGGASGGGTADRQSPVAVSGVFSSIIAGGNHTCALDAAGAAFCWGLTHDGQTGNGSFCCGLTTSFVTAVKGGLGFGFP
jgi:alpha-tubulin suppressor-like RCC1 family protein